MGKSLRNKSKLKFRTIKRAQGVFGKVDKERTLRLAQKLGTAGTGASASAEPAEAVPAEDVMETEAVAEEPAAVEAEGEKKKVSTSGWKGSRNDSYKKRQAKLHKNKKTTLTFARKKK